MGTHAAVLGKHTCRTVWTTVTTEAPIAIIAAITALTVYTVWTKGAIDCWSAILASITWYTVRTVGTVCALYTLGAVCTVHTTLVCYCVTRRVTGINTVVIGAVKDCNSFVCMITHDVTRMFTKGIECCTVNHFWTMFEYGSGIVYALFECAVNLVRGCTSRNNTLTILGHLQTYVIWSKLK